MTHRILSEHPRIVEIAEEMATVEAARAKFLARRKEEQADYQARREQWQIERLSALDVGDPVPDPPSPPDSKTDEARYYVEKLAGLRQDRRDAYASISSEIEAAASDRETELLDRARALIDQLAEIADECSELLDAVRQVSTAEAVADGIAPESRRRLRHSLSVADLVRTVTAGERPLDPIERKTARLAGPRPGEP